MSHYKDLSACLKNDTATTNAHLSRATVREQYLPQLPQIQQCASKVMVKMSIRFAFVEQAGEEYDEYLNQSKRYERRDVLRHLEGAILWAS